jgi:hypothetical protein
MVAPATKNSSSGRQVQRRAARSYLQNCQEMSGEAGANPVDRKLLPLERVSRGRFNYHSLIPPTVLRKVTERGRRVWWQLIAPAAGSIWTGRCDHQLFTPAVLHQLPDQAGTNATGRSLLLHKVSGEAVATGRQPVCPTLCQPVCQLSRQTVRQCLCQPASARSTMLIGVTWIGKL